MADTAIENETEDTSPQADDKVVTWDKSANANKGVELGNIMNSVGIVKDTTPQLGGTLQGNGFGISLDNSNSYASKDSGGTGRAIIIVSGTDVITMGPSVTGWGAETRLNAGTFVALRVDLAAGAAVEAMRATVDGNILIGTVTDPSANDGKVLVFGDNGATGPTMGSNTAGLYGKDVSGTVEMFAVDEAGNDSQLSSHYQPPGKPMHADVQMPTHTVSSSNRYTGEKITYDLHALAMAVEKLTGDKIIYRETIDKQDWDADQIEGIRQRDEQIASGEDLEPISVKPAPGWLA